MKNSKKEKFEKREKAWLLENGKRIIELVPVAIIFNNNDRIGNVNNNNDNNHDYL